MPVSTDSPAVAIARAHVAAWSTHDYDTARASLAADVTVASTTTQPIMAPVHLAGVDNYMEGLIHFAQTVVPGTAEVLAAAGADRVPGVAESGQRVLDLGVRRVARRGAGQRPGGRRERRQAELTHRRVELRVHVTELDQRLVVILDSRRQRARVDDLDEHPAV